LGREFLNHYQLDAADLISVIYFKDQTLYLKSDAVIEIAKDLKGTWKLLRLLRWFPKSLRDALYMGIAKNRYRLFGRKHNCSIDKED
jgi:predicted DCC family thiol-disulfide oxidoreductase YuxK